MQVRQRSRQAFQITSVGPYASSHAARSRRRWVWLPVPFVLLVLAGLAFAYFAWPSGSLAAGGAGLARLASPSFGGASVRVTARTADGRPVPVAVTSSGVVWPQRRLTAGTRLQVEAVFRRPGWIGWIAGRAQHVRVWVTAPSASLSQTWLQVKKGTPLRLRFSRPVSAVSVSGPGKPRVDVLPHLARSVSLGRVADAGRIEVSAVARRWERFPRPVGVTWFATGAGPQLIATPAPGSLLGRHTPLVLQFSRPVKQLLHGHTPWLGRIPGSWRVADSHTLVFTPRGFGFGLDTPVRLRLPAAVRTVAAGHTATRLVTWRTPTGSPLRLHQLLAELGYLPLAWRPSGADAIRTIDDQLEAAADPPAGTFSWRYGNVPAELSGLWKPGRENDITRGAIMAFESDHDLSTDGYAGRDVWQALIAAVMSGDRGRSDYSYVIVHRSARPQTLVLWHNGKTLLTTPANTGIPQAPTVFGTFPVYARFRVTTMRGTAPDGSHYSDPGIPWVSYFNGGDAIHGFTRASYGSPQSLGCVELPASEAARVFPYTPIGTLVTVTS